MHTAALTAFAKTAAGQEALRSRWVADLKVGTTYCGQRPEVPVKQTIELGVTFLFAQLLLPDDDAAQSADLRVSTTYCRARVRYHYILHP